MGRMRRTSQSYEWQGKRYKTKTTRRNLLDDKRKQKRNSRSCRRPPN